MITLWLFCLLTLAPHIDNTSSSEATSDLKFQTEYGVYVFLFADRNYPIKTHYYSDVVWVPVSIAPGGSLSQDRPYRERVEALKRRFMSAILSQYDERDDGLAFQQVFYPEPFDHRFGPERNSELLLRSDAMREQAHSALQSALQTDEQALGFRVRRVSL